MSDEVDILKSLGQSKTKFNAGILKLFRIDKIRKSIHDARMGDNYDLWRKSLKGIRSEFNERMDSDEREKAQQMESMIKNIVRANEKDPEDILFDYELWLADIERKYGYGMPDAPQDQSTEV